MATTEMKIITLEKLGVYDNLVKKYLIDSDTKSLKSVKINGRTLEFYKVAEPFGDDILPAYSVTIPETDLTAINAAITAVEKDVEALEGKVTTLVGDDSSKSVRTIANEELTKQLIPDGAKESLDTLQEIAAWIQSHPDDASAMNTAIETLKNLVGTIPSGVTATTIVAYIKELVDAEKTRATGVESGIDTRVKSLETLTGNGGSIATAIADAKKAGTDAQADVDSLEKRVETLESVSYVEATDDEINALFA